MIKNLNQLRRTLREGTQLEILDHCRPECIGQIRNITLVANDAPVTCLLHKIAVYKLLVLFLRHIS